MRQWHQGRTTLETPKKGSRIAVAAAKLHQISEQGRPGNPGSVWYRLRAGDILDAATEDAVRASRRSQESLLFPWVLLLGAPAVAACSSPKTDAVFEGFSWENKCAGPGPAPCYYRTDVDAEGLVTDTVSSSVTTFALEPGEFAQLKADLTSAKTVALFRQGCHAQVSGDQITVTLKLAGEPSLTIDWVCPYDETVKTVETWVSILERRGHPDAGVADAALDGASVVDAGVCKGEEGDLYRQGWIEPCPSLVDAGVPVLFCQSPGIRVLGAQCGQRQTPRWDWGSHLQHARGPRGHSCRGPRGA